MTRIQRMIYRNSELPFRSQDWACLHKFSEDNPCAASCVTVTEFNFLPRSAGVDVVSTLCDRPRGTAPKKYRATVKAETVICKKKALRRWLCKRGARARTRKGNRLSDKEERTKPHQSRSDKKVKEATKKASQHLVEVTLINFSLNFSCVNR